MSESLLSVGYVARRGVHLQREADINQPTTAVVAAHHVFSRTRQNPFKCRRFPALAVRFDSGNGYVANSILPIRCKSLGTAVLLTASSSAFPTVSKTHG